MMARHATFLLVATVPALVLAGGGRDRETASASMSVARLQEVPVRAVRLGDGFWKTRLTTNARVSIPAFFASLEQAGALDKLRGRPHHARGNSDADVGKWIEAASLALESDADPELRRLLGQVVECLLTSSEPGGYLRTQYGQKMPAALAPKMERRCLRRSRASES